MQVRDDGLAFRHELARRAVEQSLTALRRRTLHRRVIAALAEAEPRDLPRLVHHAVRADDVEAILAYAPAAGREAAAAGSHRQALAHLEAALRHAERLPDRERARLHDDHAWELHNAHRHEEAVAESERAVALFTAIAEPLALGSALVRLSRHRYHDGRHRRRRSRRRGRRRAAPPRRPQARRRRGRSPRPTSAPSARSPSTAARRGPAPALRRAQVLADRPRAARPRRAVPELRGPRRDRHRRRSPGRAAAGQHALAARHGADEAVARGYTNLSEMLYRSCSSTSWSGAGRRAGVHRRTRLLVARLQPQRALAACWRCGAVTGPPPSPGWAWSTRTPTRDAHRRRPPYGRLLARRGGLDRLTEALLAGLGAGTRGHGH